MEDVIFALMMTFLEKQNLLYHMSKNDLLTGHGITELHVLQMIGKTETATLTDIAETLRLTKGAISKTIKKLTEQGFLWSYMREGNRQRIYYTLTDTGLELFEAHEEQDRIWLDYNRRFLRGLSPDELQNAARYLKLYDDFLEAEIRTLSTPDGEGEPIE